MGDLIAFPCPAPDRRPEPLWREAVGHELREERRTAERTLADVATGRGLDAVPLRGRARPQGAELGGARRGRRRSRPAPGRPDLAGQPPAERRRSPVRSARGLAASVAGEHLRSSSSARCRYARRPRRGRREPAAQQPDRRPRRARRSVAVASSVPSVDDLDPRRDLDRRRPGPPAGRAADPGRACPRSPAGRPAVRRRARPAPRPIRRRRSPRGRARRGRPRRGWRPR